MVFVKCSLFPSIFAIFLLVCVISVLLQHGHGYGAIPEPRHALKCKQSTETEIFIARTDENKIKEMCSKATHCMAMFCSSAKNGFFVNTWFCSPFGPENKAQCEKEGPDGANHIRANAEAETKMRAPAATDWKCTCHFGVLGKDMDNAQFVAPAPPVVKQKKGKSTSSRHGVGMPLMAIGLIIGFLPLFRGAIFDQLNP
ncbi:hypothetical protein niasHT_002748 [Heterodera trifolii]|uniref:Secreted protein n=1 Tax=Heterodera trifolii TaxID=157864 RepID=A0ABD2MA34_9BILA